MLFYEMFEEFKFEYDYIKIEKLINSADRIIIKNKNIKKEIDYDRFEEYKDIVKEFVRIFRNTFTEEQTNNMLKNLNTLKIKKEIAPRISFSNQYSAGKYDSKNNIITIEIKDKEHIKQTLFHELLHMASTKTKGNENYCGFSLESIIGFGFNEDYTEYLLEKFFNKEEEENSRYFILYEIERLVGEKKLEELYFNADFPSLIKELSKYSSKKEIVKILYKYDGLYNFTYTNGLTYRLENRVIKLRRSK